MWNKRWKNNKLYLALTRRCRGDRRLPNADIWSEKPWIGSGLMALKSEEYGSHDKIALKRADGAIWRMARGHAYMAAVEAGERFSKRKTTSAYLTHQWFSGLTLCRAMTAKIGQKSVCCRIQLASIDFLYHSRWLNFGISTFMLALSVNEWRLIWNRCRRLSAKIHWLNFIAEALEFMLGFFGIFTLQSSSLNDIAQTQDNAKHRY